MTLTADTPRVAVTEEGTIVGTFQYMSPEQIEGKELDGRSDIFSLGAVLYETVTGQKAFQGKSQLSVASAILEKEPAPISTIKPLTPGGVLADGTSGFGSVGNTGVAGFCGIGGAGGIATDGRNTRTGSCFLFSSSGSGFFSTTGETGAGDFAGGAIASCVAGASCALAATCRRSSATSRWSAACSREFSLASA
jgi:serine/threonine protein kinase